MAYFDHNSTTPLHPAARDAWLKAADEAWQNPSSPYRSAARVRNLLEEARGKIASLLNCAPERVVFNSGATEGVNAILAYISGRQDLRTALGLFSPIEHSTTVESAERYFSDRKRWLRVDSAGRVRMPDFEKQLESGRPALVSVMAANNETGVIQPWTEIVSVCASRSVLYHCDASQWIGKMPTDSLGECDFVTASAHKFGGPKGVGFLVIPEGCNTFRSLLGGQQESGFRAGTEDYPGIAAMVAAWEQSRGQCRKEAEGRRRFSREFEEQIQKAIPGVRVAGEGAQRLWNTVSLIMPEFENHRWVTRLDRKGFQVSTGSACSTGDEAPSHVLAAMGISREEARRSIRVSSGWDTSEEDWRNLSEAFRAVFTELKEEGDSPLTEVISI